MRKIICRGSPAPGSRGLRGGAEVQASRDSTSQQVLHGEPIPSRFRSRTRPGGNSSRILFCRI